MGLRTTLQTAWKILRPGSPEHKANLEFLDVQQGRLLRALHFVDQPATREVTAATNEAAEF